MKFRRENPQGGNYLRFFEVEEAEAINGSPKMILKHKKTGGIVSNMLGIFDVIQIGSLQERPSEGGEDAGKLYASVLQPHV